MRSEEIYRQHGQEVYFFVLKKVRSKNIANDIFQSTFLKIHQHLDQLKSAQKVRAWAFQIARNEIANYFDRELAHEHAIASPSGEQDEQNAACCFDRFIEDLPKEYKDVIVLAYVAGKKQSEIAEALGLSLPNVKARLRRAKVRLKQQFVECCNYEINAKGQLIGTANCSICEA